MQLRFYVIAVLYVLVLSGLAPFGCSEQFHKSNASAAIVDQLYSLEPNPEFTNSVLESFEDHGFDVDVYLGDEVTVDLYRALPHQGYKFIIFRVHSGLLIKEGEIYQGTWLFTNEPYNRSKYIDERLAGRLVKARTAENKPWVFAIGSEFVTHTMEGQFDNTVILMMGCYGLYLDDLARAFIDKGATVYLGWDGNVTLPYVDRATISLMQKLCANNMTINQAVEKTIVEVGTDPDWDARTNYYPVESGDKTVTELLN